MQHIWQAQSAPQELESATLNRIATFRKKIQRQKVSTYIVLPISSLFILSMGIIYYNPYYLGGILTCIVAMALAMIQFKRIGPDAIPHTTGMDTKDFIRLQLDQFKALDTYANRFIPAYLIILWCGLFVSMIGFILDKPFQRQLLIMGLYGLGLAIYLLFAYFIGKKRLIKRFLPLREELESTLSQMEQK